MVTGWWLHERQTVGSHLGLGVYLCVVKMKNAPSDPPGGRQTHLHPRKHGVRGQCENDSTGYPLHGENRENGQKKSLSGKTQGIWIFLKNTGKTNGIWFALVVNSLALKVKDLSIFAAKIPIFFQDG